MIIIFEKDMKIPLLLDTYGPLLSERKRELMDLYYNEDYSLAEIAEETGISRQGVRDSIKKTVAELHEWESVLHTAERLREFDATLEKIRATALEALPSPDPNALRCALLDILNCVGKPTDTDEE